MDKMYLILIFIIFYLNLVATYHIFKSEFYDKEQRKYQLVLAWLLPLLGSIIVIGFAISEKEYIKVVKQEKGLSPNIIRLLTFTAFASGSGGPVSGDGLSGDGSFSNHSDGGGYGDSGGGGGGGGGDGG